MEEPQRKLVPLGNVIIQSFLVTEEEGRAWLDLIAKALPREMYVRASWVPTLPEDPN
jgi:hypothetical protein